MLYPDSFVKHASETKSFAVPFASELVTDEYLTGTPTVTELNTSDLVISNVMLSTLERTLSGLPVDAARAVEFTVSGGTRGETYTLRITSGSDATYPQTLVEDVRLEVR